MTTVLENPCPITRKRVVVLQHRLVEVYDCSW